MLMLDCGSESGGFSNLFEAGTGVNAPADAFGQSPAHLAACGGEAFFLLWQLQTGANLNQQDCLGEAPIHKAAKVGSLECLALLVAGDAKIDLCNNSGQTAADLALAHGFLECAKFLTTIQHTQTMKLRGQSSYSRSDKGGLPRGDSAAQKQESETSRSLSRKRRRADADKSSSLKSENEIKGNPKPEETGLDYALSSHMDAGILSPSEKEESSFIFTSYRRPFFSRTVVFIQL